MSVLDVGTIVASPRSETDAPLDFFQVTRVISRGTVELRQILADEGGKPIRSAFVAPPFTAAVNVQIRHGHQATVWGGLAPEEIGE